MIKRRSSWLTAIGFGLLLAIVVLSYLQMRSSRQHAVAAANQLESCIDLAKRIERLPSMRRGV